MSEEKKQIEYAVEDSGDAREALPELLGERISYLRKKKGMTQAQLADQLGISAQAVSKWEGGLSCPDITVLVPLAKLLGVSTDQLLGGGEGPAESETRIGREAPPEEESDENAGKEEKAAEIHVREKREEIHSLKIELGAAEALIRQGDKFSLEFQGYVPEAYTETVKNGVWIIKDKGLEMFFQVRNFFRGRRVIITVPEGFRFRDASFRMGAGTLTAEDICAENSSVNVGAGEVTLLNFESGPAVIKCGMGSVRLTGRLSGRCKIDCSMGVVTADLAPCKEYGYKIEVGMGDVEIGDDRFSGMGGSYRVNQDAADFFDVNCGMGSVKLNFMGQMVSG